ncbi:hypothetical protein V8G54_020652 [Vigna mungo]|uniref:Uncharacterized protein n=1 Tax=Vigna mungo TaxID=3915 RepID=A0AAQ3RWY6_VIGMU
MSQFSGRCTYHPYRPLFLLKLRLIHDMHNHRKHKRSRFTRTSFSYTNNIPAGKHNRQSLTLYRCRLLIPLFFYSIHNLRRKSTVLKSLYWLGNIKTRYPNSQTLPVFAYVLLTHTWS